MKEAIEHPEHYGGAGDTYEAIKVIEAWDLNFRLGNVLKYIARVDKKGNGLDDLKKARWYLEREIGRRSYNNTYVPENETRYCETLPGYEQGERI
jgi:hypothetical protein